MYILDKSVFRHMCRFFSAAVFCLIFSVIYESFSHGVHSVHMIGMFLYPLVGGIPYAVMLIQDAPGPNSRASSLYGAGIAALTVGSGVSGIFEIYGTTSSYVAPYWMVGILLTASGAGLYIRDRRLSRKQKSAEKY